MSIEIRAGLEMVLVGRSDRVWLGGLTRFASRIGMDKPAVLAFSNLRCLGSDLWNSRLQALYCIYQGQGPRHNNYCCFEDHPL
jgi:hypothetical protein